jgi:4-hydroxyphenylpyruvate dioxygenase
MNHWSNPTGLNGFAFLEFSGPDQNALIQQFLKMGFTQTAKHKTEAIFLFEQGNTKFIVNNTPNSQAQWHGQTHGPGACAMGFYVENAEKAYDYVVEKGAKPFLDSPLHGLKAIEAIGGSVIYFVDANNAPFNDNWDRSISQATQCEPNLILVDHLTHNVRQGNMNLWADYYINLFNFKEIRYFDITGKQTGLVSRAMGSPCGKIKIPLNESKDNKSQIVEFINDYNGEGIQHIALTTENIYHSVATLKTQGTPFLTVPETYYEMLADRIPWHSEPLTQLQALQILMDGEKTEDGGLLLQIFTENIFGPVFFEIIQRKGNDGFGEGNFQALFEAIERDQIRRGTL